MHNLANTKVVRWVRNHKKLSVFFLVLILLAVFLLRPKPPEPLETTRVKEGAIIESLSSTGSVSAENTVDLMFLTGGKVTYVGVKKGETVEKGQTVASLDQRSTQKNLQNALRDYAKQRNTFEQAKDDNDEQTPQTAANEDVKRILENNQYDLEKAVASVELQSLAREQAVLVAPISGIVTRADVIVPGVNAGATTTYTIADPESLIFQAEVDEADIGRVRLGQIVKITLDAYPDQVLYASISSIDFTSHKTETGGNAFYVESSLPVSGYDYRIGMNGDAEVIIAEKKQTLIIPISAIQEERFVYVKSGSKFTKRLVKTGLQSDTEIEILDGLEKGEELALQPDRVEEQQKKK